MSKGEGRVVELGGGPLREQRAAGRAWCSSVQLEGCSIHGARTGLRAANGSAVHEASPLHSPHLVVDVHAEGDARVEGGLHTNAPRDSLRISIHHGMVQHLLLLARLQAHVTMHAAAWGSA